MSYSDVLHGGLENIVRQILCWKNWKKTQRAVTHCVFFYRRAMKQQETDTMEEEKMKKRAKKIVALFLTAGILLSGTAACSNVEACIFQDRQGN